MLASKSIYNFSNNILISSFENTPDFSKIKNNFTIWGKRKSASTNSEGTPIRLRYAINEKPKTYTTFGGKTYRTYDPLETGEFVKTPNPPDTLLGEPLDENWWDVKDWAELYRMFIGEYPNRMLSAYYSDKDGVFIDLNSSKDNTSGR